MCGGDEAKETWVETAWAESAEESRTQEKNGQRSSGSKPCLKNRGHYPVFEKALFMKS